MLCWHKADGKSLRLILKARADFFVISSALSLFEESEWCDLHL